jgi:hypothetical protein
MSEESPQVSFDEQSFLLDFIDVFKNLAPDYVRSQGAQEVAKVLDSSASGFSGDVTSVSKTITQYKNFIQLEDKMPYATLNRILAHDPNTLNELTSDQMSSLTPHIKIYKEVKNGSKIQNIAFPFGNFTSLVDRVDSITKSTFQRGVDAGIKNISFKDVGTNPVNVGYAFEGSMELYFQSFDALFRDRETDEGTIRFGDLLDMIRATGATKRMSELTEKQVSSLNQKKGFKIKIEMGWNVPSDPGRTLGFDIKDGASGITLRDRINAQKRTYLIHNVDQELQVDSKDGSVNLTLHFMAAINAVAYSPKADLLYIDPNNEGDEYSQRLNQLAGELTDLEYREAELGMDIDEIRNAMASRQISATRGSGAATISDLADIAQNNSLEAGYSDSTAPASISSNRSPQAQLSKLLKEKLAELEILQGRYSVKKSEQKSLSYKRLHNILRTRTNGVRFVDLKPGNIHDYENYLNETAEIFSRKKKNQYTSRNDLTKDLKRKKGLVRTLQQTLSEQVNTNIGAIQARNTVGADFYSKVLASQSKEDSKEIKSQNKYNMFEKDSDTRRVHYFFLGDLLEAMMTIVYKSPKTNAKTGVTTASNAKDSIYEDIKFLSGTFDYTDPLTGRIVKGMAFADIPVSWAYFNGWFVDKVVKPQRKSYSLYTFIQDLCGSLINNLLSPARYGGLKDFKSLKPVLQAIRIPNASLVNKVWRKRKGKMKRRLKTTTLVSQTNIEGRLDYRNSQEWFFLSVGGTPVTELTKLHAKATQGRVRTSLVNTYRIPHFIVGAQSGMLKDISFKRMQIPFRREWAIAQQSNEVKKNLLFMDKYDASVVLFGSPIYTPGMLIYVDPVGFGLVSTLDKAEWATQLGIGGYYRIVNVATTINEQEFTTQLTTVAELDFRDIAFANNI